MMMDVSMICFVFQHPENGFEFELGATIMINRAMLDEDSMRIQTV